MNNTNKPIEPKPIRGWALVDIHTNKVVCVSLGKPTAPLSKTIPVLIHPISPTQSKQAEPAPWRCECGVLNASFRTECYECKFLKPEILEGNHSNAQEEAKARSDEFRIGQEVIVYDRFRFAIPLKARIMTMSSVNDGVEIRLLESNNKHYPIDSDTWVHASQLKAIASHPEPKAGEEITDSVTDYIIKSLREENQKLRTDQRKLHDIVDELHLKKQECIKLESIAEERLGKILELTKENEELQATFDLSWDAQMRAVAEWRKQDPEGRKLKLPDQKEHTLWLITELAEAKTSLRLKEQEVEKMREALKEIHEELNCPARVTTGYNVTISIPARRAVEEALSPSNEPLPAQAKSVEEPKEWLIWSMEHRRWWSADRQGYCIFRDEAGRYSMSEAKEIVMGANQYNPNNPNEAMIHVCWSPKSAMESQKKEN
jgi:hypothetical protein